MFAGGRDSSVPVPKCPWDISVLVPNCPDTSAPVGWRRNVWCSRRSSRHSEIAFCTLQTYLSPFSHAFRNIYKNNWYHITLKFVKITP